MSAIPTQRRPRKDGRARGAPGNPRGATPARARTHGEIRVGASRPADVATVGEDATVLDALKVMAQRDTAAVAVVSPIGLIGIFSERDHARNCLMGNRTANNTPVVDIMTRSVAVVAPADSVRRCLIVMNERQVTHVAVLDQGQLVGLLSQADLLAARIAYHERIFHETEMDRKLLFLSGTYSC